jgi:hypothetical protein
LVIRSKIKQFVSQIFKVLVCAYIFVRTHKVVRENMCNMLAGEAENPSTLTDYIFNVQCRRRSYSTNWKLPTND